MKIWILTVKVLCTMIVKDLITLKKAIVASSSGDFRAKHVIYIISDDLQFVIMSCWILDRVISSISRCEVYGYSANWIQYLLDNVTITYREYKLITIDRRVGLSPSYRTRMATPKMSIAKLLHLLVPEDVNCLSLHCMYNVSLSNISSLNKMQ